jgi:hypothetical protein
VPDFDSDALAASLMACHARVIRIAAQQRMRGPVMMAAVESGGHLELAINASWRADPLGMVDSSALLRRRYAAAVRDPMRSVWRERLQGLFRAVPHRPGADPFGEQLAFGEDHAMTSEILLMDGRYLRLSTGGRTVCEAGTWRSGTVRSRVPGEILDALEHRRAYDLPIRRFAHAIGVGDETASAAGSGAVAASDIDYADVEILARACVARAAERPPTPAEHERGDVAGLDIAVYALLDQLVWSAADLSDLLTGRWSPWAG